MVGGNVCMNRMYGITYPAFEIQPVLGSPVKEKIDLVGNVDASATLAVEGVGGTVAAVGGSPIAIANRRNQSDTPTIPKDGKVTTNP